MNIKIEADIPLLEFVNLADKHGCDLILDKENGQLKIVDKSERWADLPRPPAVPPGRSVTGKPPAESKGIQDNANWAPPRRSAD